MWYFAQQILERGNLPQTKANQDTIGDVLTIVFVIAGAVAVLVIVIAGFRLIASAGKAEEVAAARRQIAYAFVGLVLAAMAATLVNYVLGRF